MNRRSTSLLCGTILLVLLWVVAVCDQRAKQDRALGMLQSRFPNMTVIFGVSDGVDPRSPFRAVRDSLCSVFPRTLIYLPDGIHLGRGPGLCKDDTAALLAIRRLRVLSFCGVEEIDEGCWNVISQHPSLERLDIFRKHFERSESPFLRSPGGTCRIEVLKDPVE